MSTKKERFIKSLRDLGHAIVHEGLDTIDIEDGALAYMLERCARLIEEHVPEDKV